MEWLILFLAGLAEAAWAICLKYTAGFTKPVPTLMTVSLMGVSFFLLAHALKSLPLGTAYAVWVGIGTVGTVIAGIILFDESRNLMRILCVMLIIVGVVGLRLVDTQKPVPPLANLITEADAGKPEA